MAHGSQAHNDLARKVEAKDGWQSEPELIGKSGNIYKPDTETKRGYLLDFKPNTESGRRAGAEKKALYERELGRKTRIVYYDE